MTRNRTKPVLGDPFDADLLPEYQAEEDQESSVASTGPDPEQQEQDLEPPGKGEDQDNKQTPPSSSDTVLGQPDPEPDSWAEVREVPEDEIRQLRKDQEKLQRQFEEKLLEMERTGFKIPGILSRIGLWVAVFLGALLGIFLLNQGLRFADQISSLSMPWSALATLVFLLFLGLLLFVVVRLAVKLLAFRNLTKFDLKALKLLAERKRFRILAEQKQKEAKSVLSNYVREYDPNRLKGQAQGLSSREQKGLIASRKRLLDSQEYLDTQSWLKDFEESFVRVLDKKGQNRIRAYTSSVALGTAASPIKFIDQMIVLYAALKMISELLQIYNLRPAMGQSIAILGRSIVQAYLSGVVGEHSQAGLEGFADYYESIFGEISFTTGVSAATDAAKYVFPRVSEGALNGFLLWRLGKQAQKMIRPI